MELRCRRWAAMARRRESGYVHDSFRFFDKSVQIVNVNFERSSAARNPVIARSLEMPTRKPVRDSITRGSGKMSNKNQDLSKTPLQLRIPFGIAEQAVLHAEEAWPHRSIALARSSTAGNKFSTLKKRGLIEAGVQDSGIYRRSRGSPRGNPTALNRRSGHPAWWTYGSGMPLLGHLRRAVLFRFVADSVAECSWGHFFVVGLRAVMYWSRVLRSAEHCVREDSDAVA